MVKQQRLHSGHARLALGCAALLALILFGITLQLDINGSSDPYVTDVGEIQNALPRWGTIHFTGYPLYTLLGSLFVSALRLLGVLPAAASSLYSAVWGAISVALLVRLLLDLGVQPLFSALAGLLYVMTTSMWVFGSIAEVHTMTLAITFASLLVALRFGRTGRTRDLYWLAFLVGQGLAHQRAYGFLGPALLLLVGRQWRAWRRIVQKLPVLAALALLGPLTYLYLPLRDWMGAAWLFNSPGTWDGFWSTIMDTKTGRIIELPRTLSEWWQRLRGVALLLHRDMPWYMLLLGALGVILPVGELRSNERGALVLAGAAYLALGLIIWIGRVGEAVLAANLLTVAVAVIGLALLAQDLVEYRAWLGPGVFVFLLAGAVLLFWVQRPGVLEITRDPSADEVIRQADRIRPAGDGRPSALMALWGNDYWQLAYAQAYLGRLPQLELGQHDRNLGALLQKGYHLYTLDRTFYQRPSNWWEQQLGGPAVLSSPYPRVAEIDTRPHLASAAELATAFDLGNGIQILHASLAWDSSTSLLLTLQWYATADDLLDYSVAVHLVTRDPPTGSQDIVAQADLLHPVVGRYPTSRWVSGQLVTDSFQLTVPADAAPCAVRVGMYRILDDNTFLNSEWLSLAPPPRP